MIYRIYKEHGRIGTGLETTEIAFTEMQNDFPIAVNRTALALFDSETNTIHILNDKIFDVSSLVQKFKIYCNIPNKHQFNISHQ